MLVRANSRGGTHEFLTWLTAKTRRLPYSIGMTVTSDMQDAFVKVPAGAWTPAYDGNSTVRDAAWVADITGMLDLSGWPAVMRVIVRKERPHPGAQLRFTAFATDTERASSRTWNCGTADGPDARTFRCAKDTGLRSLPLKGFAQNQTWCEITALASEPIAWTQMLALSGSARR